MKNIVCDFTIGFDKDIEDIVMYDEDGFTKEQMETFINKMIKEKQIVIGEKCEGSIFSEDRNNVGVFIIEYKWCSEVGEDWDSDIWNDEQIELFQCW